MKILIYGYGNPGRQDDGLGDAFVNHIEKWVKEEGLEGISFDSNYQLNMEDAHEISDKDVVIFADASVEEIADFCVTKVDQDAKVTFTTHAASPGYIVDLCQKIYGKTPITYLLHMKGYTWEFAEGLSDKALANLALAVSYFKNKLKVPEDLLEPEKVVKSC